MKNKHTVKKAISSALILSSVLTFAAAADLGTGSVKTAGSPLNMRSQASTSSQLLKKLPNGSQVTLLELSNGWYKITANGTSGYVSADYIVPATAAAASPVVASSESSAQTSATLQSGRVVTAGSALNMRSKPDSSSSVVRKLANGTQVTVLESKNGWYSVSCGDSTGYVSAEYIVLGNDGALGAVTGSVVNMRSAPGTSATVVTKLHKYDVIQIKALSGDWYMVSVNGQTGYVHKDYLSTDVDGVLSKKSLRQDIVDYAKKYLGVAYRSGGSSPKNGFDCSGFTKYVFSNFGISLPHSSASQVSSCTKISKSELQPGDLVFFANPNNSSKRVGHVGIYIGGNQFIHAASPGKGVRIDDMNSSYYSKYYISSGRLV